MGSEMCIRDRCMDARRQVGAGWGDMDRSVMLDSNNAVQEEIAAVEQEDLEALDVVNSIQDRHSRVNREASFAGNATRSERRNTSTLLMTQTCAILEHLASDTLPIFITIPVEDWQETNQDQNSEYYQNEQEYTGNVDSLVIDHTTPYDSYPLPNPANLSQI